MDKIEKKLWRKVERWRFLFEKMPFVRLVCVGNSLAFETSDKDSDIDLFIVTAKGRLYTARFFVNLILKIFGLRVNGKKLAGRFCLSFMIDESDLDVWRFAIEDDIYLYFWLNKLVPVMAKGVLGKFEKANGVDLDKSRLKVCKKAEDSVGGGRIEDYLRSRQIKHLKAKVGANEDGVGTVIEKDVFKLHSYDKRAFVRDRYRRLFPEGMDADKFTSLLLSLKSHGK
ncbi:hypothetical protein HOE67_01235 [Candidatus Peregrinibacteria bacterium]|jgi:predicted nucleotidyltransferase|nr:hypothetical protein [Candidatus Peregrinibacteria bacterium]MBT4055710.1 hypothetical protein [Candidatus Peregrinibacteria bacterium]